MDAAYYNWLWLLGGGAILGLFVKPRTVFKVAAIGMGIAVAGLVVSALASAGPATWLFGIAAMAIPIAGALGTLGAWLGSMLAQAARRKS